MAGSAKDDSMDYEFRNGELKFNKVLTDLDILVSEFVGILNKVGIKYVLISGYVALLLGRSRATDDVDLFIERIDQVKFAQFCKELDKAGYWILNCEDERDAFSMLDEKLNPRFAKKGQSVPNFEIKFAKKETDFISLENPLKVVVDDIVFNTSTLEMQVAYKIKLGSDKDIEDATHIYSLFKENINKQKMRDIAEKLGVGKKMVEYGLE